MNSTKSKIAIIGAGSIGILIGGLLLRAGEDVTLVTRQKYADAMNKNGLTIEGAFGDFKVPSRAAAKLDFKPDLALLTVKSQDVDSMCEQTKDYIEGVPLLTLQNGVESDQLASSVVGKDNIISGIIMFNANFKGGGVVQSGRDGTLIIGEAFQENGSRVNNIAEVLNKGVKTVVKDNVAGGRWSKLIANILGNSLEAMTGMPNKVCLQYPNLRENGIMQVREAFNILNKTGVKLSSLPGLPIHVFETIMKSPMVIPSELLKVAFGNVTTTSSTLQSLKRGVPSEIDYLNGEIVKRGKEFQLPTPYNAKVVELIHNIEKTGKFYSPEEIEKIFSDIN
ncbi:MAG TPA: 2-dehydropantoate 2-reductase [Saprospiraceae bacterium]|nr:2-dehydropantoate 2-reductase [Saprospiraceae bacterium]